MKKLIVLALAAVLALSAVSALAMAVFIRLAEKKRWDWLDNFSVAGSMLLGMLAAALAGR